VPRRPEERPTNIYSRPPLPHLPKIGGSEVTWKYVKNFHSAALQALSELVASTGLDQVIEDSGHWIMEEQPEQAVTIIHSFLKGE
jgi:pimeloyl-ACP methyl ester carboxylesterase